jgi:thiamine-phosphate pyrophosphorylase
MIRCLVTDRRRARLPEQFRAAIRDGIELIQIRERDLPASELAALVRDAVNAARGSATRILVNDRLDVALACGADGVHLRADSIPPSQVRRIAPEGFLIAQAIHSVDEARRAADVDYVVAGTVFATPSKPDADRWLGIDGLRAVVQASRAPVLAIGGVTPDRISEILRTGAAGIAAIGLFLPTAERFDSPGTAP